MKRLRSARAVAHDIATHPGWHYNPETQRMELPLKPIEFDLEIAKLLDGMMQRTLGVFGVPAQLLGTPGNHEPFDPGL